MNTTINSGEPPYTTGDTGNPDVTVPYSFGFFFVILFILITLCYGSYIYKIHGTRTRPLSRALTTFTSGTTTNQHHTDTDQHVITISQGLDGNVIDSFPSFVYSEAMMVDTSTDANVNSGCSICLMDYKPTDVVRLLPECGHLFHVNCIDTWLNLHPTCPVCRNSPLPMV